MTRDDPDDADPDRGREHIEVLRETLDRTHGRDWAAYRDRYRFTVVGDGRVRLSALGGGERAVETSVDHVVTVEDGGAVGCNCHTARTRDRRCRHMRAVDSHPRL
jgi:hypothetical protein